MVAFTIGTGGEDEVAVIGARAFEDGAEAGATDLAAVDEDLLGTAEPGR
ncbi:hypothetical protein [Streptomyces sp. NPDC002676]